MTDPKVVNLSASRHGCRERPALYRYNKPTDCSQGMTQIGRAGNSREGRARPLGTGGGGWSEVPHFLQGQTGGGFVDVRSVCEASG